MLQRLLKEERGAVAVFTVLVIAMGILVFAGLVVDAGFLYNGHKQMVTAADAGALAGAMEMEKTLIDHSEYYVSQVKQAAVAIARQVAIDNGAEGTPEVVIKNKLVRLSNGTQDYRQVIEVKAQKSQPLYFMRLVNTTSTNVSAASTATWGYTQTVTGGQLLPLYIDKETLKTTLHDGKQTFNDNLYPNQHGFMYIDPTWHGAEDLNKAISGSPTKITLALNTVFEGKAGSQESMIAAVETRMKTAQKLTTPTERKNFMYGLVPVVTLASSSGGKLYFNIEYFAVYEILDVMTATNKGSPEALAAPNYTRSGVAKSYSGYSKGTILGRFTGEVRQLDVVIRDGDQDYNHDYTDADLYSKLVP